MGWRRTKDLPPPQERTLCYTSRLFTCSVFYPQLGLFFWEGGGGKYTPKISLRIIMWAFCERFLILRPGLFNCKNLHLPRKLFFSVSLKSVHSLSPKNFSGQIKECTLFFEKFFWRNKECTLFLKNFFGPKLNSGHSFQPKKWLFEQKSVEKFFSAKKECTLFIWKIFLAN